MKTRIILLAAVIALAFGCSGTATETVEREKKTAPEFEAMTEANVKDALEALRSAVELNDGDALAKMYTDDYHLVNPEGKIETKADRMESMKSGKIKYEKVEFTDPKIRIYGNTAVVVTGAKGKANMDGKDTEMDMTATIVFVKTKDGVGEVSAQLTNRAKEE